MGQTDLFGDEISEMMVRRTKAEKFEDYDAFVAKFDKKAKKTTDDCFTPQPVYEAVLRWLRERVNLEGRSIIRPFYPGGDYENEEYPENCVVVDNPPFSILARIIRFYLTAKIDYFLFAPGLTLFSACHADGNTAIVANCSIVYANGACVNTGFHTSLFPGNKILVSASLHRAVLLAMKKGVVSRRNSATVPPPCFETAARLHTAIGDRDIWVKDEECFFVRTLDAQERAGTSAFGGGYLIADVKAREIAAARQQRQQYFCLSPRELKILENLNNNENKNRN